MNKAPSANSDPGVQSPGREIKSHWVFLLLWFILFILYLPAAKGGWVHDTVDWVKRIREERFWDYINIMQSLVPSLYQFTQFTTYVFYRLFHTNPWAWHILFITLQAVNGTLLFLITKKLFRGAGLKHGVFIALGGVLLFCICPHISEVVVWKASYHYLQGFLLILAIVYWAQKFQYDPQIKYAWYAGITFLLSVFSLEIFYLTPCIVLSVALYYYYVLSVEKKVFRKTVLHFVLPELIIFSGYLVLLHFITGFYTGHVVGADLVQPLVQYLRKPPTHLFHNLFLGRFFPDSIRQGVYTFFVTIPGLLLFYSLIAVYCFYLLFYFKKIKPSAKAIALIFLWWLMYNAIVCPLWISDIQYVSSDRYAYFMLPFTYLLFCYAIIKLLPFRMATILFTLYAAVNIYCTVKVNRYWKESSHIVYNLSHSIPDPGNKIILLLNVPANMNGIQMIGSLPNSAFKTIYNVNNAKKLTNTTYDVLSYNMKTPGDGAHVAIYNDTLLHVTLNQWGSWWWYGRLGGRSYENEAYKLNLIDLGHWYELILKHPLSDYLLLYQVGDQWKEVDVSKKSIDQY